MIKLISIDQNLVNEVVVTLFADTKAEVAETGSATNVFGGTSKPISAGSMLYTASMEIALLKSDDTWNWV